MNINYYQYKNKILISEKIYDFKKISETEAMRYEGMLYVLKDMEPSESRRNFCVSSASHLFLDGENLEILIKMEPKFAVPKWIKEAINEKRVMSVNTNYPNWGMLLEEHNSDKKKVVSIAGMGDVGGMLTSGLRLLGADIISQINIYDKDVNRTKRWEIECNSILPPCNNGNYPEVAGIDEENLFNCDIFVFCVSIGVPELGKEEVDVRLAQFKGNSKIISYYAKLARSRGFKGIFAVVSDPVDLLCSVVFTESNKNLEGEMDYLGLNPEQIKGYGLGVMYARAAYYSKDIKGCNFIDEGRAFGSHGEGLVIANSIENYDESISITLTNKARHSNLEVRAAGYKPYVAPALSSGTLSLISTIKGEWHYSTNFIGGVFFGCRNRESKSGIEFDCCNIPDILFKKMTSTYNYLKNYTL